MGLIGWLQIFAQSKSWQAFGLPKSRLVKVRTKNIGVHLVDCHNNNRKHFLFYFFMSAFSLLCSLRTFQRLCQNFGHKHWCANSLAMNQLMTKYFGLAWFWLGKNWKPTKQAHYLLLKKILKHIPVLRFGKMTYLCIRNSVSMVHRLREGALTRGTDVGLTLLP